MKKLLNIFFLSVLSLMGNAQNDSLFFSSYMAKGEAIFEKLKRGDRTVDFDSAIKAYNTAMLIFPKYADSARGAISDVFRYIEEVNNEKIRQTEKAERNYRDMEKAKEEALGLQRAAESARDKFNLFNLANAPYRYIRLIRDGPTDAAKISESAFDSMLIAYSTHLDIIGDSLNRVTDERLKEAGIPDARKDYNTLRENLDFNNDLYEKIFACLDFHGAREKVLRPLPPDTAFFRIQQFSGRQVRFLLSADSSAILQQGASTLNNSYSREEQTFTAFTLADQFNRIICATDDHFIYMYEPGQDGMPVLVDSIAMGAQVTALDFVDSGRVLLFGTSGGYLGFIRFNGDFSKFQPVYTTRNFFEGSKITALDFFEHDGVNFLFAAGYNGNAVVYKVDSLLVQGYQFSGNALPDPNNELGGILHGRFDKEAGQIRLETTKAPQFYQWDPFTKTALSHYRARMNVKDKVLQDILMATQYY